MISHQQQQHDNCDLFVGESCQYFGRCKHPEDAQGDNTNYEGEARTNPFFVKSNYDEQ